MGREKLYLLLGLSGCLILSGCVVRTYPLTKDRVDQDLNAGNRGFLAGQAPSIQEKERKTTRTTQVIEIELGSPIKFEKQAKTKTKETTVGQPTENKPADANRGYITQSIAPEVNEPAASAAQSFENYTVQKNDTLQKIAKKYYGSSKQWMKIYAANKDILKGPDKVYPGQVIKIPVESPKETKENLK